MIMPSSAPTPDEVARAQRVVQLVDLARPGAAADHRAHAPVLHELGGELELGAARVARGDDARRRSTMSRGATSTDGPLNVVSTTSRPPGASAPSDHARLAAEPSRSTTTSAPRRQRAGSATAPKSLESTASTPSSRSRNSSLAVVASRPATRAPRSAATWTMCAPTPPAAAITATRSPAPIAARAATCTGVAIASGIADAATGSMPSGSGTMLRSGSTTRSA